MGSLTSEPVPEYLRVSCVEHPVENVLRSFERLQMISLLGDLKLKRTKKTYTLILSHNWGEEICRYRGESLCKALDGLIRKYEEQA